MLFLLSATVIAVLISLSYGLVQLVGLDPIPWGRTSTTGGITRIFGTMGNPNFFAAFLLMGFPMVAYYSSRTYNRGHRLLSACLMITAILDVIMIFASNSRGSWIGFIATVSVYLGGVYFLAKDRKFVSRIFISLVTGLLGFVVISMSSENGQRFAHALKDRGLSLINIRSLNHEARRYIWESAIRMFEDHPIFGVGLDGFQLAFEHYRTVEYWNAEWNGTPAKAHNEILHILATQGIFGGFATLVIVLGIMIAFKRALQLNLINHKLTIALFSGIVGFLVQDLFSFTVAGCGTLFVTYAALLSSFGRWELKINSIPINVPPISRNGAFLPRLLYAVFSGGIILALIKFMYFPYKANLYCSLGLSMINTDSARSVSWFQKAVQLDPHKELYWVQLGKANRLSARKESDPIQRNIYFHEAYNAYIQSIHLVPENSYNWANLGRLLSDMIQESLSKDLRQEIYLAFSKALALDPNNAYFYLSGSKAVLSMGDSGTAFDWAEKCVKRYPSFEPCMSQYKYIKSIASHPTLESAFQK